MLAAPIMRDIPREHPSRLAAIRSRLASNNNSSSSSQRRKPARKQQQPHTAPVSPSSTERPPVIKRAASVADSSSLAPPPPALSSSPSSSSASSSVASLTSLDPNLLLLLPGDENSRSSQNDGYASYNSHACMPRDALDSKERRKDVKAFFTSFASRFGPLFASNASAALYDDSSDLSSFVDEKQQKKFLSSSQRSVRGSRGSSSNKSKKASSPAPALPSLHQHQQQQQQHVVVEDIVTAMAIIPEPVALARSSSSNYAAIDSMANTPSLDSATTVAFDEPAYGVTAHISETQPEVELLLQQQQHQQEQQQQQQQQQQQLQSEKQNYNADSVPRNFAELSSDAYDVLTFPHSDHEPVYSSPVEDIFANDHSILASSFDSRLPTSLYEEFTSLNQHRPQQQQQMHTSPSPIIATAHPSPHSIPSPPALAHAVSSSQLRKRSHDDFPALSHAVSSSQLRKRSHEDFSGEQTHQLHHMPSQQLRVVEWQENHHQQQQQQQQQFQAEFLADIRCEDSMLLTGDQNSDRETKRRYASSATSRSPSVSPAQFYMPLPTASAEAEMHLSSSIPPSSAHLHTTSPPLLQHQRSMDTFLMRSAPSSTRPTNRRQQHQQRLQRARSQPSLIRASSSAAHLPSFVNAPLPMDFATLSQQQFMIQPTHQPVQQVGLGLSLADAPLIPGQVPQHRAAMVSPPTVSSPSSLPSPSSLSATKKKRSESGRATAAASSAGGVTFNNLTPKDHVKIMSSVAKSGSNKSKKPTNKKK